MILKKKKLAVAIAAICAGTGCESFQQYCDEEGRQVLRDISPWQTVEAGVGAACATVEVLEIAGNSPRINEGEENAKK